MPSRKGRKKKKPADRSSGPSTSTGSRESLADPESNQPSHSVGPTTTGNAEDVGGGKREIKAKRHRKARAQGDMEEAGRLILSSADIATACSLFTIGVFKFFVAKMDISVAAILAPSAFFQFFAGFLAAILCETDLKVEACGLSLQAMAATSHLLVMAVKILPPTDLEAQQYPRAVETVVFSIWAFVEMFVMYFDLFVSVTPDLNAEKMIYYVNKALTMVAAILSAVDANTNNDGLTTSAGVFWMLAGLTSVIHLVWKSSALHCSSS